MKTQRIAQKRVLLEVSDDGPGIPEAIQARVFDPFFTTKPAGVGTGLGLAIVLGIVREHGGTVHLTSNPGHTVFSIELPARAPVEMPLPATGGVPSVRARRQSLPAAPEPLETSHTGANLAAWAGTRVLVLEDEPTVARLIADVLKDEGLHVNGRLPQGGQQRLETIAALAVRLRETVRRLSQEYETHLPPTP